jgi:hypothetical protein
MSVPRMLFCILASSLVGSCVQPAAQTPAQTVARERTIFTDSTLYARYCHTAQDSLMPAPDSSNRRICQLRDQRQTLFKIF